MITVTDCFPKYIISQIREVILDARICRYPPLGKHLS